MGRIMAALSRNGTGTLTGGGLFKGEATSPLPDQSQVKDEGASPLKEQRTAAYIDRREKGDQQARDLYSGQEGAAAETEDAQAAAATRRQLAEETCDAIARVLASHGSVRMASHLQLLKRQLSKCHDALGPLKSEADFLSIVVLVELELGNRDWKSLSRPELQDLKTVLQVGVKEPQVTFDHYNQM